MTRFIAFYLPQFHPVDVNNQFYGKGFTEWHNVVKAKKLFPGHNQPHIPSDLGFYDLRLVETRLKQAELAKEYGIEGFCYWDYWFGNGKRILETIFDEVVKSKEPDFPFCLGWANHSWHKKLWDSKAKGKDILIIEQKYLGVDDYEEHFYTYLSAFKDKRYIRVGNKLLYIIHSVKGNENYIVEFINTWRKLAKTNGLNDFYFVARDFDSRYKKEFIKLGFDSILNDDTINIHHHLNISSKIFLFLLRKIKIPTLFSYRKAIKYMINDDCVSEDTIPVISPNWDHSPRSGRNAMILVNSKPKYFKELVKKALEITRNKQSDKKIVFIKSWNEWGEGNYLEPDEEFGHGYLNALKQAIEESVNKDN